jgi:hypothetical protein
MKCTIPWISVYIYYICSQALTQTLSLFHVSSSIIIFIFYYHPFLSSIMDCFSIDLVPIILILTMIPCDSFYNSILTKDWKDV